MEKTPNSPISDKIDNQSLSSQSYDHNDNGIKKMNSQSTDQNDNQSLSSPSFDRNDNGINKKTNKKSLKEDFRKSTPVIYNASINVRNDLWIY